jgi:type II secretory pathway pseudopilin PulG
VEGIEPAKLNCAGHALSPSKRGPKLDQRPADSSASGRLPRGEAGASLVELLVAVAISSVVLTMLGSAVFQFYSISSYGQARMAVLHDLQNAGLWLGRDASEAADFTPGGGNIYGTFDWSDSSVQFRYSYDAADNALVREQLLGGVVQSTVTVARHIAAQGDVSFTPTGQRVSVDITATSAGVTASHTIILAMRVP